MRSFQTRNVVLGMHRHASLRTRRVSCYGARNITIDEKIFPYGEHRARFFTCHLMRHSRLEKKEKKRIAIAGRFALVRQHTQTAITKMVHKRGPVPARQGTRQGFYREGPKSLPLSRVETPK